MQISPCAAERERHLRQMWDVGAPSVKVLKQRFTQWFNGSRPVRRRGTLWEDRFRSVLVERGEALRTMAAYIDLNPVRAHLTIHPQDYRWCGYGEACAGGKTAKAGLHRVLEGARDTGGSLKKEWQEDTGACWRATSAKSPANRPPQSRQTLTRRPRQPRCTSIFASGCGISRTDRCWEPAIS